jgi:outer membrane lipoprotein-sorting protein
MSHSMTRRSAVALFALLTAAPAIAAPTLSADDQGLVAKAVAYLEGLPTVKARFTQTGPRGDVATGTLWLARPGRARFEYAPPSRLLITSDGKTVVLSDGRLNTFHRYPLDATPLGVFLAKQIRLDRGAKVTAVTKGADGFSITAHDAKSPSSGWITLYFLGAPTRLIGWAVVDAQRKTTRVTLEDLAPAPTPPDSLFVQVKPARQAD